MRIAVLGVRGIPGIQGGVETHCEQLYTRIAARGHEVVVICRKAYMNSTGMTSYHGVRLVALASPKSRSAETFVHTFLGLVRARFMGVDLLHIHAIGPSLMVPLARLLGMRVVTTNHGPDYDRQKWGRAARLVLKTGERVGSRFSHGVIAISKPIAESLWSAYRCRAVVIPNGVVVNPRVASTDVLSTFGLTAGRYVLCVGRLVPEKGFHDLIEAFARAGLAGWKLVLVGRADHESAYSRQLIEQAAAARDVVMTGFQSGGPLAALYSHAGLFALPSYHEGLPIALLEALSYGLPAIASDIPANRQVGLPDDRFFPAGDVALAARRMQVAAARPFDEQDATRQIAEVAAHFDWDVISEQTIAFYERVLRDLPTQAGEPVGAGGGVNRPGNAS